MNKILVAIFDEESTAYKGLSSLRDIHNDGDISLYSAAVIVKDTSGKVIVKETLGEGPIGTALGMLTGSIVGLLGGPVGVAVGASLGGLTGMLMDLDNVGIDIDFVDEVSKALTPGKAAVIADIEETWIMPVDSKIGRLSGKVYRRLRSEVVEDQLARESAALTAELNQLEEELKQANAENKAALQKHINTLKDKIKTLQNQANTRIENLRSDTEAKMASFKEQMRQAADSKKAKIEKRIADIKTDFNTRSTKLKQAQELTKEAIFG